MAKTKTRVYEPDRGGIKKFQVSVKCPICGKETVLPIGELTTGVTIYSKLTQTCSCGKYQYQVQYLNTGNVLLMHRTRTKKLFKPEQYGKWYWTYAFQWAYAQQYTPELTRRYKRKEIETNYVYK